MPRRLGTQTSLVRATYLIEVKHPPHIDPATAVRSGGYNFWAPKLKRLGAGTSADRYHFANVRYGDIEEESVEIVRCEGCTGYAVAGVRWVHPDEATHAGGWPSRVERCDSCEMYEDDAAARAALLSSFPGLKAVDEPDFAEGPPYVWAAVAPDEWERPKAWPTEGAWSAMTPDNSEATYVVTLTVPVSIHPYPVPRDLKAALAENLRDRINADSVIGTADDISYVQAGPIHKV